MKLCSEGLVIWHKKTTDANRVVTILTPGGVVTAYAKNAARPSSKLASATSMLAYSDFELFAGGTMYNVDDASCIQRFVGLTADMNGFALATYFCELLKNLAPIDDDASEFLSLALNSLYLINENKKPLLQIKAVFELLCVSLAGYMPDIAACRACGERDDEAFYFDTLAGSLMCAECAEASAKTLNAGKGTVLAMRHILESGIKGAFSFSLGESALSNLAALSEEFVLAQLDFEPQTLQYFKKLAQ